MKGFRSDWPIYVAPWILLGVSIAAWISTGERLVESALVRVERGEASPRIQQVVDKFRQSLGYRYDIRFTYGGPLPIPVSYVRKAWESTWRPRAWFVLVLGGAMFCLTCNVLLAAGRRAGSEQASANRTRVGVAALLGAGAIFLLTQLAMPLSTRTVYTVDDLFSYHIPIRKFIVDSLTRSDTARWCPLLNSGCDLQGEGQAGLDHPWHKFLYRALPLDVAINLELLGGYVFALVGMTALLRRWGLSIGPSLFGAFTFTFGVMYRKYFHLNATGVISHIPWLLLYIDLLAGAPGPRVAAATRAAIALLTASQLLLGYPQWVWISLMAEGLYLMLCAASGGRPARLLAGYFTAKTFGLLLGAIQLVPTIDALLNSKRTASDPQSFLALYSLHPLNFLLMVCPYAVTSGFGPSVISEQVFSVYCWPEVMENPGLNIQELSLYTGLTPVLLLAGGLLAPFSLHSRPWGSYARVVVFGSLLAVVGALLALGRFSPLFRLSIHVPVINVFRCPARYAMIMSLGLTVLASFGLERLLRSRQSWRGVVRHVVVPVALILTLNLFALALRVGLIRDSHGVLDSNLPAWPLFALNPILAVTLLGLFVLALRGVRWALPLLALAHVADVSLYDLPLLWRHEPYTRTLAGLCDPDGVPADWYRGRILVEDSRERNPHIMHGVQVANAYLGLSPRSELDYCRPETLRVAGVGLVLSSWVISEARPIPNPLPEVRLVPRVRQSQDPGRDLATIDAETTALVDVPLAIADRPDVTPGVAHVVARRNAEYRIQTRADSVQLLVVSTRYHSGWKAEVDGAPAGVVRAYGDFLGCAVQAGEHEVHLIWKPASQRIGQAGSSLGMALLTVSLVFPAILRTRRKRGRLEEGKGDTGDDVAGA